MKNKIFWIFALIIMLAVSAKMATASNKFWDASIASQNAGDYIAYYNVDVVNTTFLKNYSQGKFDIVNGYLENPSNAGSGFEFNNTLFSTNGNYTIAFEFYPVSANGGQAWFSINRTGGANWQPSLFASNSVSDSVGIWIGSWSVFSETIAFTTGKWYNISINVQNITSGKIRVNLTIWNSSTLVISGDRVADTSTWGRGFFFGYAGMDTADSTSDAARFRNIRVFNGSDVPTAGAGADTIPPKYNNNYTNFTTIKMNYGLNFTLNWTEETGMSCAWAETNITGENLNSSYICLSGLMINVSFNFTNNNSQGKQVYFRFWANDTSNNKNDTGIVVYTISNTAPVLGTITPSDGFNNINNLTAQLTPTDADNDLLSCSLLVNGTIGNFTNSSVTAGTLLNLSTNNTATEGAYKWNVSCWDGSELTISGNRVFNLYYVPVIENITSMTTGGISGTSYTLNQIMDWVGAGCSNSLLLGCNITITKPTGTTITSNTPMTSITANRFNYTTDFNLDSAGTWTISVSGHNEFRTGTTASTFSVGIINLSVTDGLYYYSYNTIPNATNISRLVTWNIQGVEISFNQSTLNADWTGIKRAIVDANAQNIHTGLRLMLDLNCSANSNITDGVSRIDSKFPDLKSDPYAQNVEYITIEAINISNCDSDQMNKTINDFASNITTATANNFVVYSDNFAYGFPSVYATYTPLLYINSNTQAGWITAENKLLKTNESLNRVYIDLNNTLMESVHSYHTTIIDKLRSKTNTTSGLNFTYNWSVAGMKNTDIVVFNNASSEAMVDVNASVLSSAIGKYAWDATHQYPIEANSNLSFRVNVSAESATMIFFESLDRIQFGTAWTAFKASTPLVLSFNFTRDKQFTTGGGNVTSNLAMYGNFNFYQNLYDPHYSMNFNKCFVTYYGQLNASRMNISSSPCLYTIIGDKMDEGVDRLNYSGRIFLGYESVANFANTGAWWNHITARIDNWTILNGSMGIFIDGVDNATLGANFSSQFKRLIEYVTITKGIPRNMTCINDYTTYQNYSGLTGCVMKESAMMRWNGVSAGSPNSYTWEDINLEINKSAFFKSHGIIVLGQSFCNRTADEPASPVRITNYTQMRDVFFAYKVIYGNQLWYCAQPDFNYAFFEPMPDLGDDMANSFSTDDNITYNRRYANGVVYFNSSSKHGWIDNGETINNISISTLVYDAHANQVTFTSSVNEEYTGSSQGKYNIPDTEIPTFVWSWITFFLNVSDFDYGGRYDFYFSVYPATVIAGQGGNAGYYEDVMNDADAWYDNGASPENYLLLGTNPNRNWISNLKINKTYSTSIDTTSRITQTNTSNSTTGEYNLTLSSSIAFPIRVVSDTWCIPSLSFKNLTYFNGTGITKMFPQNTSTCTGNNPIINDTNIAGENHGSCFTQNTNNICFRIATPKLSTQLYTTNFGESVFVNDFISQIPSDITTTNLHGVQLNISFNMTGTSILDGSRILFYKTNSTINNIAYYLNGTSYSGYFQTKPFSNSTFVYKFVLEDHEVYPTTYNVQPAIMENTIHNSHHMNASAHYIKIELWNVSGTTEYNQFDIMVNASTSATLIEYRYCNSSYTTGSPALSPNCVVFYNQDPTPLFNHSSNYTSHKFAPMTIQNGFVSGSVWATPVSYFLIRGSPIGGGRYVHYINQTARLGATQTTTNNGASWTNETFSVDANLHQYTGNYTFYYYTSMNDTLGSVNTSTIRIDLLNFSGLPPSSPVINPPNNSVIYSGIISINYTASISPNGYSITYYNVSLLNIDQSFNATIRANNSLNLSVNWNSINYSGEYVIRVEAKDVNGFTSIGLSDNISIDNTNPALKIIQYASDFTSTDGNFNVTFNASDTNLKNCSLYRGDLFKMSINSFNQSQTQNFTFSLGAGNYYYYVICYDNSTNFNQSATINLYVNLAGSGGSSTIGGGGGGGGITPTIVNASNISTINILNISTISIPEANFTNATTEKKNLSIGDLEIELTMKDKMELGRNYPIEVRLSKEGNPISAKGLTLVISDGNKDIFNIENFVERETGRYSSIISIAPQMQLGSYLGELRILYENNVVKSKSFLIEIAPQQRNWFESVLDTISNFFKSIWKYLASNNEAT